MAKILSISSSVTTSHVGNSVTSFVFQRLGHEVWPLNTIALPHHPGHGTMAPLACNVTQAEGLGAALEALERDHWLGEIDAVLVGYMANAGQSREVARWLPRLRRLSPGLIVMIDPIMGDDGALYVDTGVAEAARDLLLPLADIAKPNRFELGWLTGETIAGEIATLRAAQTLGVAETVVTSTPAARGELANLVLSGGEVHATQTRRFDNAPKGTGDLFGAVYLSSRLNGEPPARALERATAGVYGILSATQNSGRRELALVAGQDSLVETGCPFPAREINWQPGDRFEKGTG